MLRDFALKLEKYLYVLIYVHKCLKMNMPFRRLSYDELSHFIFALFSKTSKANLLKLSRLFNVDSRKKNLDSFSKNWQKCTGKWSWLLKVKTANAFLGVRTWMTLVLWILCFIHTLSTQQQYVNRVRFISRRCHFLDLMDMVLSLTCARACVRFVVSWTHLDA